jgi:UDP-N-acetylglucosamine 2-epimerase (non-hydrolysing)
MPVIFSTHPRTQKRIQNKNIKFHHLIKNIEPLGFFDYVSLQKQAMLVLSDSGTISEESAMLNFKAVSIRTSTERPEAIDTGSILLAGIDKVTMRNAVEMTLAIELNQKSVPNEYNIENTSDIVVKIIQGYTSVVNKVIWFKQPYI